MGQDALLADAFAKPEIKRLLRTGTGVGERKLGLMAGVSKDRRHHLSDREISDIHAYLVARAKLPSR